MNIEGHSIYSWFQGILEHKSFDMLLKVSISLQGLILILNWVHGENVFMP